MAWGSGQKIELKDIPFKSTGGPFHGVIGAYNFFVQKQNNNEEGGEIMLNKATSGSYYAAMDVCYNVFRIHSNNGTRLEINLSTGAFTCPGGVGDYAEKIPSIIEQPGMCVFMDTDGILKLTTNRLQSNCYIISDTAGICIGKEDKGTVEASVSGYVYALPYQDKNKYHLGDCVCSAPNGTVDIMTRQEIQEYPDRIVGIVSIKPNEKQMNIEKKDYLWIKIK